jgi:hypothetical protein
LDCPQAEDILRQALPATADLIAGLSALADTLTVIVSADVA